MISKSRFLGYCLPVASEQEAQETLSRIRKQHYDARHCCYAFRLLKGGVARSSDDGEPSGTAGAPILSVITGAGLENTLIAVVRYFGGVLLGTGGLVRAYTSAASEACKASHIVSMRVCRRHRVTVSYQAYHSIEPLLRAKGYPCEATFTQEVTLNLLLPEEEADSFSAALIDRTDGTAILQPLGQSLEAYAPADHVKP